MAFGLVCESLPGAFSSPRAGPLINGRVLVLCPEEAKVSQEHVPLTGTAFGQLQETVLWLAFVPPKIFLPPSMFIV